MVLAIGLVVDDAIIVVENIHRHIEMGSRAFRQPSTAPVSSAWPIIAMTTTLVAGVPADRLPWAARYRRMLFTEFAFSWPVRC